MFPSKRVSAALFLLLIGLLDRLFLNNYYEFINNKANVLKEWIETKMVSSVHDFYKIVWFISETKILIIHFRMTQNESFLANATIFQEGHEF